MHRGGFTLIELSIVLVIIGLLAGGVLVGRDLIAAAALRSQITQIEKYNAAANTFRAKYGFLPGDLPANQAAALGFATRTAPTAMATAMDMSMENTGPVLLNSLPSVAKPCSFGLTSARPR